MKQTFYYSPDAADTAISNTTTDAGAKTDNTPLIIAAPISISPDGGETDEPFPKPNVPYDFVTFIENKGQQKTGAFFVEFSFNPASENPNPDAELKFAQEAGLDANASVKAVVHFGSFPNEFNTYHVEACLYMASAPDSPLNCVSYDITINTQDQVTQNEDDAVKQETEDSFV